MSSQSNQMQVGQPSRSTERSSALDRAIRKRANGVPTYTVPEAAALLSISQEYLYRLIQAEAFPAVRMGLGGRHGRYVIAAKAVEHLLDGAVGDAALQPTEKSPNLRGGTA